MAYLSRYSRMAAGDSFFKKLGRIAKGAVSTIGKVAQSPIGTAASFLIPGGIALKGASLALKARGALTAGRALLAARGARTAAAGVGGFGAAYTASKLAKGAGVGRALLVGGAGLGGGAAVGSLTAGGGYGGAYTEARRGTLTVDPETGAYSVRRRYRRQNPLNPKAARRAISRIKKLRKITQEIERALPRARSSAPRYAFQRRRRAK